MVFGTGDFAAVRPQDGEGAGAKSQRSKERVQPVADWLPTAATKIGHCEGCYGTPRRLWCIRLPSGRSFCLCLRCKRRAGVGPYGKDAKRIKPPEEQSVEQPQEDIGPYGKPGKRSKPTSEQPAEQPADCAATISCSAEGKQEHETPAQVPGVVGARGAERAMDKDWLVNTDPNYVKPEGWAFEEERGSPAWEERKRRRSIVLDAVAMLIGFRSCPRCKSVLVTGKQDPVVRCFKGKCEYQHPLILRVTNLVERALGWQPSLGRLAWNPTAVAESDKVLWSDITALGPGLQVEVRKMEAAERSASLSCHGDA